MNLNSTDRSDETEATDEHTYTRKSARAPPDYELIDKLRVEADDQMRKVRNSWGREEEKRRIEAGLPSMRVSNANIIILSDDGPKKPLSGYKIFKKENKNRVRDENPNATDTEITQFLRDAWGNLKSSDRNAYDRISNQEKQIFHKQVEEIRTKNRFTNADGTITLINRRITRKLSRSMKNKQVRK